MPESSRVGREQVRERILEVVSADYGCTPAELLDGQVHLFELPPGPARQPGRRRYPDVDPHFAAVSFGRGAVITASVGWLPWVREICRERSRDELFDVGVLSAVSERVRPEGHRILGPHLRFALAEAELRELPAAPGYAIELSDGAGLRDLAHADWPNAIGRVPRPERPNRAAAIARRDGKIVGAAGASEDAERLWQIGIDVVAAHRGVGLGAQLTAEVARATFEQGAVPYYSLLPGNLPSMRTALSVGFRPTWIEVVTTPLDA